MTIGCTREPHCRAAAIIKQPAPPCGFISLSKRPGTTETPSLATCCDMNPGAHVIVGGNAYRHQPHE
ncbi:hypothetical protein QCE80_17265, partial [Staphylococcus aureus]|nr:hypothetical protein [Staphylococcus aureus]